MRKNRLLLIFLIGNIFISLAQRNLIIDGRFDNAYIHPGETNNRGEWFYLSLDDEKSVKDIIGDEHQGTVAYLSSTTTTDIFKSFIGQWIENVYEQGIYRVSFSARSMSTVNETELYVYLRIKNSEKYKLFCLNENINQLPPVSKVKLTNNWEYFTVEFDLSKVYITDTTAHNKFKLSQIAESDKSDFSNFHIAFSTDSPDAQIRFTDVFISRNN